MERTANLQSLCMLLVVCFLIFCGSSVASGQNVNDDGTLTFANLPEGEPYNIATGVIYTGGFTLRTTWNIIDGFLKMISPAGPPYSVVVEAIGGNLDFQSALPQIRGNLVGFIVLFVLGMVFLLIFSLFLLIFCCCRLCGNCGGKMIQKNSSKFEMKRYVFTGLLLLMLFFLVFAAITALAVSGYTSSQVSSLPDTITNNIDDMLTYVNNTLEEIDFLILEQLSWTIDQVSNDLDGIDDLVGVPVREALRPTVGAAIDAVYPLSAYISNTLSAMEDVNSTQSDLEMIYSNLAAELTDIVSDLNTQCGSCSCCSGFDYSGLSMNMDPRDINIAMAHGTFPQAAVDVSISELQSVEDQDLTSAADVGSANFENIPTTLANTTSEVVTDLITTLEGLEGTIYSTINASTSQLSSLNTAATDLKATLDPILSQAVDIDGYRKLAMSLVFGFMLFLVFLFVIGVAIAVIGHCLKKKPPASRSGIESCGGCVIMIAAVISAILVPPFLLISSFTFLIGGPVDRLVCDNLISLELFTETIDQPDTIVEGYFLGETIFQDSSINLTVTGMLNACENNSGIYTAFKLDNLLNITQFTDIDGFVGDVDSQFGNITGDFSGVNILTGETRNILIDFRDGEADQITWDPFLRELDEDVTNDVNDGNDLSVLAAAMRTAAASISPASDATAIENLADDLDTIQTMYMDPFISTKNTLKSQVYILTNYTSNIDSIVNTTIDAADDAQDYLDNNAVSLVQTNVIGYQDRVMGYPYQFATYIENQIRNEVGKCLPVYNLYSSSVNTLCVGFVQAFNGFWYCLGLCCITMVFTFAFGVKSAKYYRKMKKDTGFEDQNYGYPLTDADSYLGTK